jgi:hypothetical protein
MRTLGELTAIDAHIKQNLLREDMWGGRRIPHNALCLGLPSEEAHLGIEFFPFPFTRGQGIFGSFSRSTAILPAMDIDVMVSLRGRTARAPHQMEGEGRVTRAELAELLGCHPRHGSVVEAITPAAAAYAKSHGLYGAVVLAKKVVHEVIPSMRALSVDLKQDPDEGGYPTICFTMTIKESVDHVLDLDDALQDALYDRIPAELLPYLSFSYHFE